MGKKSKNKPSNKSKQKELRAVGKRVERFVDKREVSYDDLAMAGVGLLATTLPDKKQKKQAKKAAKAFDKLVKRGRRLAPEGLAPEPEPAPHPESAEPEPEPQVKQAETEATSATSTEPVISYQAHDDGWYTIQVDDIEVDRVQGEEAAAERAGELLAKYAALELGDQRSGETALTHTGGGWYVVIVNGVPIDRMRGRDATHERYGHFDQQD